MGQDCLKVLYWIAVAIFGCDSSGNCQNYTSNISWDWILLFIFACNPMRNEEFHQQQNPNKPTNRDNNYSVCVWSETENQRTVTSINVLTFTPWLHLSTLQHFMTVSKASQTYRPTTKVRKEWNKTYHMSFHYKITHQITRNALLEGIIETFSGGACPRTPLACWARCATLVRRTIWTVKIYIQKWMHIESTLATPLMTYDLKHMWNVWSYNMQRQHTEWWIRLVEITWPNEQVYIMLD